MAARRQVIGAEEPPGEENARWPSGALRGSAAPPPRPPAPPAAAAAPARRAGGKRPGYSPAAPQPVPGRGTEPWGSATACARGSSATPAAPSRPAPAPPRSPSRRPSRTPPRSRSLWGRARCSGPAASPAAAKRTGRRCCCRTAAATGRPPSGRRCPRPAAPAGERRRGSSRRSTRRRPCRDPGRSCAWRSARRRRRRGKSARASTGRSKSRSGSTSRRTACCYWVRAGRAGAGRCPAGLPPPPFVSPRPSGRPRPCPGRSPPPVALLLLPLLLLLRRAAVPPARTAPPRRPGGRERARKGGKMATAGRAPEGGLPRLPVGKGGGGRSLLVRRSGARAPGDVGRSVPRAAFAAGCRPSISVVGFGPRFSSPRCYVRSAAALLFLSIS